MPWLVVDFNQNFQYLHLLGMPCNRAASLTNTYNECKIKFILEKNEKTLDKKERIGYNVRCHCVKAYFIAKRQNASDLN